MQLCSPIRSAFTYVDTSVSNKLNWEPGRDDLRLPIWAGPNPLAPPPFFCINSLLMCPSSGQLLCVCNSPYHTSSFAGAFCCNKSFTHLICVVSCRSRVGSPQTDPNTTPLPHHAVPDEHAPLMSTISSVGTGDDEVCSCSSGCTQFLVC